MGTVRSLATLCLVGLLAWPGCALGVSGPDPDRPRNEVPRCDTGKGAVALDGVWASLAGVGALAAFSNDESGTGVALAGVTALFTATAVRGNNAANQCRAAFDEYAMETNRQQQRDLIAQRPVSPVPLKRPPPKKVEKPRVPDEEAEPEEDTQPTVPPEYTVPRPPVPTKPVKPPPQPQPPPQTPPPPVTPKKPPPAAVDDDWSDFWREAP